MSAFNSPEFASSREAPQDDNSKRGETFQPSTLSERIELLDRDTRSCWNRVDELEDEEAALKQQLLMLENIRRKERIEVLGIENECKSLEMKILKSDEEAAQLDEESRELEAIVQQAAEDTLAAAEAHVTSVSDGSNVGDSSQSGRAEGSAALTAVLRNMPVHEEKQKQTTSFLQEHESKTRSRIAEFGRLAAELRRSKKKRGADSLSLERETTALRDELTAMVDDSEVDVVSTLDAFLITEEIEASVVRARQVGDGLRRRLLHANEKLSSVRDSLAQGSARDLEEEEQRSLELLQGINEARATLHPPVDRAHVPHNSSNHAQRGVRATTAATAKAPAQSRHNVNRSGSYHGRQSIVSKNPSTWREWT